MRFNSFATFAVSIPLEVVIGRDSFHLWIWCDFPVTSPFGYSWGQCMRPGATRQDSVVMFLILCWSDKDTTRRPGIWTAVGSLHCHRFLSFFVGDNKSVST